MNERLRHVVGGAFLLFGATLIGCTAMRRLPVADAVVPYGENESKDVLELGRVLMVTECTGCHRPYWPSEFSPRQWSDIAQNMANRASFTTPQTDAFRSYVMAAARAEAAAK